MAFLKNKLSWHGTTSPNTVMNNLHIVLLLCYYSPDFCSLLFSKMAFQPNQFILKQPPSSQPYKLRELCHRFATNFYFRELSHQFATNFFMGELSHRFAIDNDHVHAAFL